jgi:hypothetical protein
MWYSVSYSHFGAAHLRTPRPIRAPGGRPSPFWCDVSDTPWSKTMRNHVVAATLVSGPGVPRTWRFYSQAHRDS